VVALLTRRLVVLRSRFKSRARLEAENIILCQQLIVLSRKPPVRAGLRNMDRLLFVWLYRGRSALHAPALAFSPG
jgi:hypothetical protein